jgi:hypothetical protein
VEEVTDRRGDPTKPDNGLRRRKADIEERQDEFRLLRDQILLAVGAIGVLGIGLAAVIIGVKDSAVALAALTVFATLLGAPTVLRLDEKRRMG